MLAHCQSPLLFGNTNIQPNAIRTGSDATEETLEAQSWGITVSTSPSVKSPCIDLISDRRLLIEMWRYRRIAAEACKKQERSSERETLTASVVVHQKSMRVGVADGTSAKRTRPRRRWA